MADSKITALAALTAADPVNDMFPVVDVSDTSMAASGTTKRISANNILSSSPTASGALTVTGLVTAGSASITGAATVGTTFAVGTVTPDIFGRFYTRSIGFDSSGSTVLQIDGTSYGGIDLGAAGVRTFSVTSSATDANISTVTNIPLNFNINSTTQMILNTSGNLVFGNTKGIDFSATANSSGTMTSELLNDYEEGTFTPTPNSGTFSAASGRYTKIGNMVTIFFDLTVGTGGGSQITNLPFVSAATSTVASGIYTNAQTYAALTTAPVVVIGGSGSTMYFRTVGTGVAFSAMTLTAAASLTGSISYFV